MKIFNLNNLIRFGIINFFIFLVAFIYFNNLEESKRVDSILESKAENQQIIASVTENPLNEKDTPIKNNSETETELASTPVPVKKEETLEELAEKHVTKEDCWIIYSGHVYDITGYFGSHPGGDKIMLKYCGQDATEAFNSKDKSPAVPHSESAGKLLLQYLVR